MLLNQPRIVAATAALCAVCSPAFSDIINVPFDQPTIQGAIDVASDGDEIVVAQGTWAGFEIGGNGKAASNLTVRSTDPMDVEAVTSTIINSGVFVCNHVATISGVTFANLNGTALSVDDSLANVTVSHCAFVGNTAGGGGFPNAGAISAQETTVQIVDCSFIRNSGTNGGAIGMLVANSKISRCTFIGNLGGAIWVYAPFTAVVVSDCTFIGNSGRAITGSVDGSLIINNSTFTGNGGAISISQGFDLDITDSTLSANIAPGPGGGIAAYNGSEVSATRTVVCANLPDQVDIDESSVLTGTLFSSDYCPPPSLSPPFVPPTNCLADITGPDGRPDGVVGFSDLVELLHSWGACPDC